MLIITCIFSGCTSPQNPATENPITSAPSAAMNTIAIKDYTFSPANLTIKPGTTVTWLNQEEAVHQIVSDAKTPISFASDSLSNGESFSFTFTMAGIFTYHCVYHPTMKGAIIVES
jgi:plastocyanin